MKLTPGSASSVAIIGDVNVVELGGNTFTAVNALTIAATATSIAATSTTRSRLFIKAAGSNTEAVFIGDSGITNPGTTEDGFPLEPGDAIELIVQAEVFGISENGSQKVYLATAGEV